MMQMHSKAAKIASNRGGAIFVLVPELCNIVLSKDNKNIKDKKMMQMTEEA
jgi:hypothetical protein